jgi:hypothetical protein
LDLTITSSNSDIVSLQWTKAGAWRASAASPCLTAGPAPFPSPAKMHRPAVYRSLHALQLTVWAAAAPPAGRSPWYATRHASRPQCRRLWRCPILGGKQTKDRANATKLAWQHVACHEWSLLAGRNTMHQSCGWACGLPGAADWSVSTSITCRDLIREQKLDGAHQHLAASHALLLPANDGSKDH